MARFIKIDNYIIDTPVIEILHKLQSILINGKLRDIKMHTDDIVVSCPHHADGLEANPDCNIYIGENKDIPYGFARCFACEFQGTFERFVAECFNSSIEYAKKWLIKNYGKIAYDVLDIDAPIEIGSNKIRHYLDETELDNYQHYCPYLTKRKLSRNICELFNVRYDPKYRQVIFPVYDIKDNLVMTAKRNIDTKVFFMTKDVEKEVYCLNYIVKNNIDTCLITEGPFDCLTAYEYGFPAIATLGALSDYQIEQINKSCIKNLYLCMDNDDAGRRFAKTLQDKLDKRIITTYVRFPENKKDLNDLSKEELIECIKKVRL